MYNLSIEFKTVQELADFVAKFGVPTHSKVEPIPEDKKKAKVKAVEPEVIAPVIPEPVEVKAPPFDRDGAIAKATDVIKQLSSIIEAPQLAQTLSDLYVEAGCPIGTKIGKLDDICLARFMPVFLKKAEEIKKASKPAQSGSFI
jgi:hypothetical protein